MSASDPDPDEELNRRLDRLRGSLSWRPSWSEALSCALHQKLDNDDSRLRSAILSGRFTSTLMIIFGLFGGLFHILSSVREGAFGPIAGLIAIYATSATLLGLIFAFAFTALSLLRRRVVALEEEIRELRRSTSVSNIPPPSTNVP